MHGSAQRVRCAAEGCVNGAPRGSLPRDGIDLAKFRADPVDDNVPKCPACGELLRQHVLWFDELYTGHDDYRWDRVHAAVGSTRLALCVGTSFAVGVTELVTSAARKTGVPLFAVLPTAPPDRSTPPSPGCR